MLGIRAFLAPPLIPPPQRTLVEGQWELTNGHRVTQLSPTVFKETRWSGDGWVFVDFHREPPAGVVCVTSDVDH